MIFYLIAQNYISSNVGAWGMWACSLFLSCRKWGVSQHANFSKKCRITFIKAHAHLQCVITTVESLRNMKLKVRGVACTFSPTSMGVEMRDLSFKHIWCGQISKFKRGIIPRKKFEWEFPLHMHIYTICSSSLQSFTIIC